jgi:hypothetical protein
MVSARTRAWLFLLCLVLLGLFALRSGSSVGPINSRVSDIDTYHAMIRSIRSGMPYYDAIGEELRRWGYATREAFNWRTPLLMTAEARVPDDVSKTVLLVLTALLCAGTARMPNTWAAGGLSLTMQLGMLALFAGTDTYVMSEPWAGVLVALSICAYHWRLRGTGVALGLTALFVRELAAPYCVVCTCMAVAQRRWREVGAWAAGAALYFAYYAWHLSNVFEHRRPTDISHVGSWLALGGVTSVVTKVHWQGWLILLPMWITALSLLVIVAGIGDSRSDFRARVTSAAYLVFFLVAGRAFDWYWGLVAWPTWALVIGAGPRRIARALSVAVNAPSSNHAADTSVERGAGGVHPEAAGK